MGKVYFRGLNNYQLRIGFLMAIATISRSAITTGICTYERMAFPVATVVIGIRDVTDIAAPID